MPCFAVPCSGQRAAPPRGCATARGARGARGLRKIRRAHSPAHSPPQSSSGGPRIRHLVVPWWAGGMAGGASPRQPLAPHLQGLTTSALRDTHCQRKAISCRTRSAILAALSARGAWSRRALWHACVDHLKLPTLRALRAWCPRVGWEGAGCRAACRRLPSPFQQASSAGPARPWARAWPARCHSAVRLSSGKKVGQCVSSEAADCGQPGAAGRGERRKGRSAQRSGQASPGLVGTGRSGLVSGHTRLQAGTTSSMLAACIASMGSLPSQLRFECLGT